MDLLLRIVDQYTYANEREQCQQVVPDTSDFESHLQPYADVYFESKLKEKKYYFAIEQIHLHKKFDGHLASGVLDGCMDEFRSSKDEMVRMQLSDLHHELIKLSLERRDELVNIQHQVITYSECLRTLIKNEPLKRQLGALVKELEEKGFFNTANNSVDWENKIFSERVDKFNNEVFTGRHLPKYYVIRGIIDYRSILMRKGSSQQAAFSEVDYFPFLQFNINELDSLLIASIRLLMKYVTGGLKVAKSSGWRQAIMSTSSMILLDDLWNRSLQQIQ
ncbi:uncharacterized protein LOC123404260 isoform X2 [Hordeum vulgare subsp. vulgare]|uniref:uncharacterized protein LOC123404260 isoform X2 n=1 Tax=Hordeum vulgare subsp. vulgare TaxID=112509 RepID=UPI001D1A3E5E|nr:uncharacterized protein LOC123404260 isoform X2 [Hordeum vulgare subsp. vulgare]